MFLVYISALVNSSMCVRYIIVFDDFYASVIHLSSFWRADRVPAALRRPRNVRTIYEQVTAEVPMIIHLNVFIWFLMAEWWARPSLSCLFHGTDGPRQPCSSAPEKSSAVLYCVLRAVHCGTIGLVRSPMDLLMPNRNMSFIEELSVMNGVGNCHFCILRGAIDVKSWDLFD